MAKTRYANGNGKTKIGFFGGASTVSRDDKKYIKIKKCPIDLKLWTQLQKASTY